MTAWDQLGDLLMNFEYLQARIGSTPPASTVYELLHDLKSSARAWPQTHALRAAVASLHRAMDRNAHILSKDVTLLVQQLHHALEREWPADTDLGRRLREAADQYARAWIRILRTTAGIHPALLRTLDHQSTVNAVAWSADGEWIASGCADGTVGIWDARTGEQRRRLDGHTAHVTSVAISPDGDWLALGSEYGTVRIWDARTGEQRQRLDGHTQGVTSVAIAPDGGWLASGGDDRTVRIWDACSGECLAWTELHDFPLAVLWDVQQTILYVADRGEPLEGRTFMCSNSSTAN